MACMIDRPGAPEEPEAPDAVPAASPSPVGELHLAARPLPLPCWLAVFLDACTDAATPPPVDFFLPITAARACARRTKQNRNPRLVSGRCVAPRHTVLRRGGLGLSPPCQLTPLRCTLGKNASLPQHYTHYQPE